MADLLPVLSACLVAIEPLDIQDRHRVAHALTAALDLTTRRAELAFVVPEPPRTETKPPSSPKPKKVTPAKPGPKDPGKYGKGVSMDQRKAESAKKRTLILEVLQNATHGITPLMAAKATGYDRATVAWHLRQLLATGQATSSGTGNTVRYHPKPDAAQANLGHGGQST